MVKLKKAIPDDWNLIQQIAYATWPDTFGAVMPIEQVNYMLDLIYNEQSLKDQMLNEGHQFILALKDNVPVGFASYQLNYNNESQLMIHKIYLLPQSQGSGIGKKLFDHLTEIAKANSNDTLRLKVFHKNDKAVGFYTKYGFITVGTETTDIGNGYIILDNVMVKKLEL
jgi:ribosomal protein S18 acetylase RimI-like enzyme